MKELPQVYKRIFLTFSCFESWPKISTFFLISATPDIEESSEEESDAVSTASKSVKSKTGR